MKTFRVSAWTDYYIAASDEDEATAIFEDSERCPEGEIKKIEIEEAS